MIFFAVLLALTGCAWLACRLGAPFVADAAACMRLALAGALFFFGADHLLMPERYLPMVQGLVPWPSFIVAFTGLCEIAGGAGLLVPRLRRLAGVVLAIYFVAVFPANIRNALQGVNVAGLPEAGWYYWVRLLFQPLAVWWALFSAGVTRWPLQRQSAPVSRQPA